MVSLPFPHTLWNGVISRKICLHGAVLGLVQGLFSKRKALHYNDPPSKSKDLFLFQRYKIGT